MNNAKNIPGPFHHDHILVHSLLLTQLRAWWHTSACDISACVLRSQNLGKTESKKNVTLHAILFNKNYNLNVLSLARMFLFGSRDLWFEVPLPFYLRTPEEEGGLGLSRTTVGLFLALYIIVYGNIQVNHARWFDVTLKPQTH
eukprot:3138429-Pyramimonas_sp.AAC.1